MRPYSFSTVSAISRVFSVEATSTATGMAWPPSFLISSATWVAASTWMSATATLAPSRASPLE